jgi:hypothetical protein
MHAMDLVGINDITRVLLVHTCQQGVYPRGHVLLLRLLFRVPACLEKPANLIQNVLKET